MPFFKANKDKYALAMQQELAARGIIVEYDNVKFCLTSDESGIAYLNNAFDEYNNAPLWMRRETLFHQAEAFKEIAGGDFSSVEYTRAMVMPRVRERSQWEETKAYMASRGIKNNYIVPRYFAGGHLTHTVVLNSPRTIKDFPRPLMDKMGLDEDTAFEIAGRNLKRLHGGFRELQPGCYRSTWYDLYDATRLMYGDLYAHLAVKGRLVAMIPNRDCLLITGEQDAAGLLTMANVATEALKLPRPMTRLAFRMDAGWVPFLPPADHPAYKALKALELEEMRILYERQQESLAASGDGTEPTFAPFKERRDKAGRRSSYTVWPEGAETSLARADEVAFMAQDPDGNPTKLLGYGSWEDVTRVLGRSLERVDVFPERFKVRTFPTLEQLAAICPELDVVQVRSTLTGLLRSPAAS